MTMPTSTEALVIDTRIDGAVQIRVLAGSFEGRALWTDSEWIKKR